MQNTKQVYCWLPIGGFFSKICICIIYITFTVIIYTLNLKQFIMYVSVSVHHTNMSAYMHISKCKHSQLFQREYNYTKTNCVNTDISSYTWWLAVIYSRVLYSYNKPTPMATN